VDPLTADVFRAFRTTFHLTRQLLDRSLASRGTHPAEAMCIRVLDGRPGISQKDLAELLHLSRPRVTGMLQELERAGVVARHTDEVDQRLTRVTLTELGRIRARELQEVFAASLGRTIGAMQPEERRELGRLLDSLAAHAARALEQEEQVPNL